MKKQLTKKKYFILIFLSMSIIGCQKEKIRLSSPSNSIQNQETAGSKSLTVGDQINSILISYLNQAGTGFESASTYFSQDFNGDNIDDVLMRKTNGFLYLYLGSATPASQNYQYPDKVGDDMYDVSYNLSPGTIIGSGFNFVRYFVADFNGDNKCDIIGQNSDGRMHLYTCNGSSLTYAGIQVRLGQAQPWSTTRKYVPVDTNGDGKYELLEIGDNGSYGSFQQTWARTAGSNTSWTSYGFNSYTKKVFDQNDQYFPINIDADSDVDLFILKANGNLYYSRNNGLSSGFTTPQVCGNGWNSFTDVYGSYHWNCITPIASLTGRNSNGDLITYRWNNSTNSFYSGVNVGSGWNFDVILTGNYIPDVSSRQDFLGINSNGIMHAYATLAIIQ